MRPLRPGPGTGSKLSRFQNGAPRAAPAFSTFAFFDDGSWGTTAHGERKHINAHTVR